MDQRVNVENCIRTLSEVAKARGIAIPSDLDIQVTAMFNKTAIISRQTTSKWIEKVNKGIKRDLPANNVSVSFSFLPRLALKRLNKAGRNENGPKHH